VAWRGVDKMAGRKSEENDKGLIGKGIIFWGWAKFVHFAGCLLWPIFYLVAAVTAGKAKSAEATAYNKAEWFPTSPAQARRAGSRTWFK
jgi:hypothetical protein